LLRYFFRPVSQSLKSRASIYGFGKLAISAESRQLNLPRRAALWLGYVRGDDLPSSRAMHVTYFDEVKADPKQGQNHYWVGGISLPMKSIATVEAEMNKLSQELFGSVELVEATEFHAKCIYFGKFPFKGWKPEKRLEMLTQLVDILVTDNEIRRVYARIDTTKLMAKHKAAEFAFAHFCERVQMLVGEQETTMLIGDLDVQESNDTIREFSSYRISGTPWSYGIEIKSIVDCVHFAHSHHSRMIQLADVYLFAASHGLSGRAGGMAKAFTEVLSARNLFPHRYKVWPTAYGAEGL
jgi:hypothetical protein